MRAFTSHVALALAVSATPPASAHRLHHAHVQRGLQVDIAGMDMSSTMNMTSDSTMAMMSAQHASPSDDEYTCPVCGMSTSDMGYDNQNHIGFIHGQTIYTCGMAPRSFNDYTLELTDTAYLAANVAEFIVNSTNVAAYAECDKSCEECESGINDPVTGENVTTANFQYVCLSNGQKIYFASAANKNEYLSNVNSEPRYLVDSILCGNATCADAENIVTLSTAAQAFVPELNVTSESSDASGSDRSSAANSVSSSIMTTLAVTGVLAAVAAMA